MFRTQLNKLERLIRHVRVPRCEIPFVILFRERSGSTHFCSILNNHEEVACRHENFFEQVVSKPDPNAADDSNLLQMGSHYYNRRLDPFHDEPILSPTNKQTITHLHDIFSCPVKASGFKFKFPTQPKLFPEIVDELLLVGKQLRVISLSRLNVLKQSISRQNMLRIQKFDDTGCLAGANLWKKQDSEEPRFDKQIEFPFHLNVGDTVRYANLLLKQQTGFDEFVSPFRETCRVLDVTYEEMLDQQDQTFRNVFEFLEIDAEADVYSDVVKATPDKLEDSISNLDELKQSVQGTDLEVYLD